MKKRAQSNGIIPSIIIACVSALALPIAYTKKDVSTLISIGIATSLLPPVANIGLTIGTYHSQPTAYNIKEKPIHNAVKYGAIIFLINSIAIFLGASMYFNKNCNSNYKKKLNIEAEFI